MTEEAKQEDENHEAPIFSDPRYALTRLINGDEVLGPVSFGVIDGEMMVQIWQPLRVSRRLFTDGTEGKFLERYASFSASPLITIGHSKIIHIAPLSDIAVRYYMSCLNHIETFTDKNDEEGIMEMINSLAKMRASATIKTTASEDQNGNVDEAELLRIKQHYVEGTNTKH